MRVAFVDTGLSSGGTYTVAGQLTRTLLARGHSGLLVAAAPPGSIASLLPAGLEVWPLTRRVTYLDKIAARERLQRHSGGRLTRLGLRAFERYGDLLNAPYVWKLRRLLRHFGPDLVNVNNSLEPVFAAWLARRPILCQLHGPLPPRLGGWERAAFRKVTAFAAVSHYVAGTAVAAGIPADRVAVIHNFIHPRENQPSRSQSRRALGLPDDVPVVAIVGRIVEWKGHVELVAALSRVAATHPRIHLLIAGDASDDTGSYGALLRKRIEEGGLAGRTRFAGHLEDSYVAYRAADVLAHCSIDPEPFGMVLVEAMDAGTPIVAANRGGPLEIVEHGRSGLLVDPRDTAQLAESITRLLSDPALRQSLVEGARARLRERFVPEAVAPRYLELCERVANRWHSAQ